MGSRWQELWDRGIGELTAYLGEHGDVAVPARYIAPSGYKLGRWVSAARDLRARGKLSDERTTQLERLGFIWRDPSKPTREDRLGRLAAYRRRHGHLDIPILYVDDDGYQLGQAMRKLRAQVRHGTLDEATTAALADLGYNPHTVLNRKRFELWLADLTDYRDTFGHTLVSPGYVTPTDWALGWWVHHIREQGHTGTLADDRRQHLTDVGFLWQLPADWSDVLEQVAQYREQFGHTRIPVRYIDDNGYRLGRDVTRIRRLDRTGHLAGEVRALLDQLGFCWS